jgi:hypothetical protein
MSQGFEDHYATLGVSPSATEEAIRKAHRQEVKRCHPDHNRSPNATQEFQRVQTAYECLIDADKRKTYDSLREAQNQQPIYSNTAQEPRAKEYEAPVYDKPTISKRTAQSFLAIATGGFVAWIVWASLLSKIIVVPTENNIAEIALYPNPTVIFSTPELAPTARLSSIAAYPTTIPAYSTVTAVKPTTTSVKPVATLVKPAAKLSNYGNPSVSMLGYITTTELNMRAQPDQDSPIIFSVSYGDQVLIIGRNRSDTWALVDVGRIGWINVKYVTTSGQTDSLPIYTAQQAAMISPSQPFSFDCPGARYTNFQQNDSFVVPHGDGPASVRTKPNGKSVITRIPEGRGGIILAGPICTGGQEGNLVWWYARSNSGYTGYVSEGYAHRSPAWISR